MSYSRILEPGRLTKALLVGLVLCVAGTSAAEAKRLRRHHVKQPAVAARSFDGGIAASPRYAAVVIDDKTGRILYAKNADEPRHPASLTKMMTLYVLFEEIERRRMTLSSRLTVSAHASSQAPSKLGLRPGQTIAVEDAIRALVTKSANDVAVTVAENVGGSESGFAKRMTSTARRLGMRGTTFYNASGLPNAAQFTTARDMVILGRALQERFPQHYRYFATRAFSWGNAVHGNHNKLLYRLEGIDGIKTGYTEASGFNLVSSFHRDGRHLVAAVMGGSSGRQRDDHMASLLSTHLAAASSGAKVSSVLRDAGRSADASDGDDDAPASFAALTPSQPGPSEVKAASEAPTRTAEVAPVEAPMAITPPVDEAPARPSVATKAGNQPRIASSDVVPITRSAYADPRSASGDHGAAVAMARAILLPQGGRAPAVDPGPARSVAAAPVPAMAPSEERGRVPSLATATIAASDVADITTGSVPRSAPAAAAAPVKVAAATPSAVQSGWLIQIGAFDGESAARTALAQAKDKGGAPLARAEGFTEAIGGGNSRMWRARFAGFRDQSAADDACRALKRKAVACLALRQ